MRFGSVCSGIEAASVAWHPLGWETAYVAEIEPFPAAVLATRLGAGRPRFMPDPAEVAFPDGWTEARAVALKRELDAAKKSAAVEDSDDQVDDEDEEAVEQPARELSEDEAAALSALSDLRDRRAAIKALDGVAWGDAIPNWGDFTKIDPNEDPIDLLVGGTPCQAFSVAGERQSLNDARGNLTLQFVRLIHATKSLRWAVWENVPGVLSTADNAFGCFLGGLIGADVAVEVPGGGKWPGAGMVSGPLGRAAWRILDAQHFGVAQRRRRVFVVFSPRAAGGDPAAVLFERKSMHGNPSPRRKAREGTSRGAQAGAGVSGAPAELAIDASPDGISGTVSAKWAKGSGGPAGDEHYNLVTDVAPPLLAGGNKTGGHRPPGSTVDNAEGLIPVEVAHTLRADGFDASEDGSGRGTPIVPVDWSPEVADPVTASEGKTYTHEGKNNFRTHNVVAVRTAQTGANGIGVSEEVAHTLDQAQGQAIAFTAKDYGGDASEELSPTLRSGGHGDSHANGGVMPAVAYAFQARIARNGRGDMGDVVNALTAEAGETGKGDSAPLVATAEPLAVMENVRAELRLSPQTDALVRGGGKPGQGYAAALTGAAVRRLTPRECERLQGFPDDHTAIEWNGEAADGPRYKALGNSMAVPVMNWIGARIAAYEAGALDAWTFEPLLFPKTEDLEPTGTAFAIQGNMIGRGDNAGPAGSGVNKETMFTLTKADVHGVAIGEAE